jgi:hypothetical protein
MFGSAISGGEYRIAVGACQDVPNASSASTRVLNVSAWHRRSLSSLALSMCPVEEIDRKIAVGERPSAITARRGNPGGIAGALACGGWCSAGVNVYLRLVQTYPA